MLFVGGKPESGNHLVLAAGGTDFFGAPRFVWQGRDVAKSGREKIACLLKGIWRFL